MTPMTPPAFPVPARESERLASLHECAVLDTPPERDFDDLTSLAAQTCDCPIAYVALIDDQRQWFKSQLGLRTPQTPREVAFCSYVVADGRMLIIEDAALDERFAGNPLVTDEPGLRFYTGLPLTLSDGSTLGTLAVADTRPRRLTDAQVRVLQALAHQATSQLELRRTVHRLMESQGKLRDAHQRLENHHRELSEAHARATAAARAKEAFLANISHEIRTPLTAIIGFSEALAAHAESNWEAREYGRRVKQNSLRLLAVVNDLLDVSAMESGDLPMHPARVDLAALLERAGADGERDAGAKGLRFSIQTDPGVPECIVADPARVERIVRELIGNAIKFTAHGGVSVRISTTASAAPERVGVCVGVRDTGIGIAQQELERLFKPFSRADESNTRRSGGAGLGLYICRRLCTLMGGGLTVDSTPGQGSEFTATIEAPAASPTPRTDVARGGAEALPGLRVLLVEDGPDNQRLLRHVLQKAGAEVEIAGDGQAAVELLLADQPPTFDLILMDMQMPRLDGYEATGRLREAGVGTPIIALTARAMSGEREKCLAAGCDDFQTKPIDRPALLACCARWAGQSSTAAGLDVHSAT